MKIQSLSCKRRNSKAISLVDILATVTIVGIILAVMLPMIHNVHKMQVKEKLEHGKTANPTKTP